MRNQKIKMIRTGWVLGFNGILIAIFLSSGISRSVDKGNINYFSIIPRYSVDSTAVTLSFYFDELPSGKSIVQWQALSYHWKNENVTNSNYSMLTPDSLMRACNFSQFAIQSYTNTIRLFSDVRACPGRTLSLKNEDYMHKEPVDTIGQEVHIRVIGPVDVERLRCDCSKNEIIRIVYFFKPTKDEMELGYEPTILFSNWFLLPEGR